MSDAAFNQVVELALKLSIPEQAKLLERIAAHLAREVESMPEVLSAESLAGRSFEVWSPQDEGGAIAALNQALREHQNPKRALDDKPDGKQD